MPKLIVFEGADGLSKTTQVNLLQKKTNAKLIRQPSEEGPLGFLREEVKHNKQYLIFERQLLHTISHVYDACVYYNGQDLIMDRCFLSGLVYGEVFGLFPNQLSLVHKLNRKVHFERLEAAGYEVHLVLLDGEKRFNAADGSIYENESSWIKVRDKYRSAFNDLQNRRYFQFSSLMSSREWNHLIKVEDKTPEQILAEVCQLTGVMG